MLTHVFVLVNPTSVGQQVLAVIFLTSVESLLCPASISLSTVSFPELLSQADCSLLPSFVNWLSLSSLGPSFSPPLPVVWANSPSGSLCGFRAKTDKEILWPALIQKEMNATYCVTIITIIKTSSLKIKKAKLGIIYIYTKILFDSLYARVGWNGHRLTKMLSWNVTKGRLFLFIFIYLFIYLFYIVPLAVYTLPPSVLQCLDFIGEKCH